MNKAAEPVICPIELERLFLTNTPENTPTDVSSNLRLDISRDGMTASLNGFVPPDTERKAVDSMLARLIKETKLVHGILPHEVLQAAGLLTQGQTLANHIIARGSAPANGQDAQITVVLATYHKQQQEDQNRDFRDRGSLPHVSSGDEIAVLQKETGGVAGKTVLGEALLAPEPRVLRFIPGHGVEISEDETRLTASLTGMLAHSEEEKFEIIDLLEISGDVDFEVGNIDFAGLVRVAGTIISGFSIKAHSLEAKALESNTIIDVQGDVKIQEGIMGSQVRAGGTVGAFFIRQANVEAKGNVMVTAEIVQSKIRAKGVISVTADSGRVVNSNLTGVRGVMAPNLVSTGQDTCQVRVGMDKEFEEMLTDLKRKITANKNTKSSLLQALAEQEPDLASMENELKELVIQMGTVTDDKTRENLMAQINMIKPLRQEVKTAVNSGQKQLDAVEIELARNTRLLKEMEVYSTGGVVRLSVKDSASVGLQIFTPRASLTLAQEQKNFSAYEAAIQDANSGTIQYVVRLGKWQPAR